MGMVVRTNTMALNAYRQLGLNNTAVSKSLEKLSSGFRINRAGDDAAGLAISEKMKAQITGLETAASNAQDGISLIQTAEGNLSEVHDMLNRMVELASKSANGTYTSQERQALQDEVDQLLEEIDRISQSANFNGTRLLDGTMGLNTDAFKIGSAAYVPDSDGKIDLSGLLAANTPANINSKALHLETAAVPDQPAKFTIDLTELNINHAGYAAGSDAKTSVDIKLGDDVLATVELDAKTAGDSDASAISNKAVAAMLAGSNKVDMDGDGTDDAVNINGYVFTVSDGTGSINFGLAGYMEGTTFKALADNPLNQAQVDTVNGMIGKNVSVAVTPAVTTGTGDSGGKVTVTQTAIHNTTKVEQAVAKADKAWAGIDLKLTADMVKDGNTLTIDGKTYTFVTTDAGHDNLAVGANEIDLRGFDEANLVHAAVDALSKETITAAETGKGRAWTIESKGNDTIHIDQTADSSKGNTLDTYEKLIGLFSAQGKATTEKFAGTSIKVTDSNVKEGDTITVGEGDTAKKYVFSDEKTGTDGSNITYVAIKGGAGKNLAAKIDGSDYDAATNTVNVRAASKSEAAPQVLGKGLTLQIGDTADDFNKMNVQVANMSSRGLNLDGLKKNGIMTEESASNAIDTIKKAINSVSTARAGMGALQNRLEHTINNLDVAVENLSAANSRIRDTDMAKEMMNYTKMNVLVQSAQAMLAQANQQPQSVLQLLQ